MYSDVSMFFLPNEKQAKVSTSVSLWKMIISASHFSQSQQSDAKIMRQFRKYFKLLSADNLETEQDCEERETKEDENVSRLWIICHPEDCQDRRQTPEHQHKSLSSCHHESSFD